MTNFPANRHITENLVAEVHQSSFRKAPQKFFTVACFKVEPLTSFDVFTRTQSQESPPQLSIYSTNILHPAVD